MRLFAPMVLLLLLGGSTSAQSHKAPPPQFDNPSAVPFFFPAGIKVTPDPVEQRQEYERYLVSGWYCNQGNKNGFQSMIPEPGSISVQTDVDSTSSVTDPHAKMRVVLDHFVRMPDGRVRVTTLCGQYFITAEQEQVVEKQLVQLVKDAAKADNEFHAVITDLAIAARSKKLGIDKAQFAASLDEPMIDNKNVTYREFNRIPKPSKTSDFVPRELHLGFNIPLDGILGVTWLNTGIIYYNPQAWITDYMTGRPKVMQHEMVHVNVNIEKFPMTEAFDAELLADMPIVLYPENQNDLPAHGYAADLREMFWIYFNFDFEEMNKQIYKIDLAGNRVVDPDKFRMYYGQLQQIKAEMLLFFQQVTIPEFYSDLAWWASVNDIRGDKNSVFRMTLAQHYNPTILGSSKESLEWAEAHREIILQTAERAFQRGVTGSTGGAGSSGDKSYHVPAYLIELYEQTFTPTERAAIEAYYKAHPEELEKVKTMSPEQLVELAKKFKATSMNGVVQ